MFEHMTYQNILQRMLERVNSPVDKREGSIIWDALAPAAVELQLMYIELDVLLQETFADTASRDFLVRRAMERGITPYSATHAMLIAQFDANVPIGSRFSLELLNYVVIEKLDNGDWKVQCETPGAEGNRYFGTLVPIDYIPNLTRAELIDVLIPGEDEEGTDSFRTRYFESFHPEAYGGNIQDYKNKVMELQGVGGVKVYPVWNGGGTVKLAILDSQHNAPSEGLLNTLQTIIDPEVNQGEGYGIAPIGHVVTVTAVQEVPVNIATDLVYQQGYGWEQLQSTIEQAIDDYLLELRCEWANNQQLAVRISQLETRILAVTGILDISGTTLNGSEENLILNSDEIPVRGSFDEAAG